MKPIKTTRKFAVNFKARIAKNERLRKAFRDALETFLYDRQAVDDHPLTGKLGRFRAFAITADQRVLYTETTAYFLLQDVGTHQEIYYR